MSPSARSARLRTALLVALGLALYWVMAVSVSSRMGVTADEVVHLTGGITYWKFNDYRMHPENGTLPMRIAALPWLFSDVHLPPLTDKTWLTSKVNLYGEKLFFESGNAIDALLFRARLVIALTGVFTIWLTWRWACGLFGRAAGWVALGLAIFCPALLAHGGLATSDMTMTACVLAALSLVWRLLHRASWVRLVLTALVCGLAFLSKMSGVLIVPLIGAMLVLRWVRRAPLVLALGGQTRCLRRRAQIVTATLALMLAVGAGSLAVLWAGYGFRFDGFNRRVSATEGYYFDWDVILDKAPVPWPNDSSLDALRPPRRPLQETPMTHLIGWLHDHRLLPEAYLWGFAHTYKFSRYRPAFFMGDYRATGWKTFFPVAFLLKTPPPALALIALGTGTLAFSLRRRADSKPGLRVKPWLYRATPLLLFFTVYWVMAINMHLNIGHRHILPTYPVFYVFASAAALWLGTRARRALTLALGVALTLHAIDSWNARPFYLSYFSPLVGGMARGYHYLVDSSYDWGQGLPDLARWLEAKKARGDPTPVYLTYFGADSPRARRLDVIRFGDELNDSGPRTFPAQVHGGWFVISATHFWRVYLPTRGSWTAEHERLYRGVAARLAAAQAAGGALDAAARAQLVKDAMDYEILQSGRLNYFLQNRPPLEVIGGSLLVFRLTDAEVNFALNAPPGELERRRAK
jgi:4-amino-4-deoxy-L-arabinose transferase-like glycosyltransferase